MGVDVVLMQVVQRGTSPKNRRLSDVDCVHDTADLFAGLCVNSGLPMLTRVNPYRTLILTSADMPQFIDEIDVTLGLEAGQPERDILNGIRRMARRCAEGTGLELHLVGD